MHEVHMARGSSINCSYSSNRNSSWSKENSSPASNFKVFISHYVLQHPDVSITFCRLSLSIKRNLPWSLRELLWWLGALGIHIGCAWRSLLLLHSPKTLPVHCSSTCIKASIITYACHTYNNSTISSSNVTVSVWSLLQSLVLPCYHHSPNTTISNDITITINIPPIPLNKKYIYRLPR